MTRTHVTTLLVSLAQPTRLLKKAKRSVGSQSPSQPHMLGNEGWPANSRPKPPWAFIEQVGMHIQHTHMYTENTSGDLRRQTSHWTVLSDS